MSVAVAVLAPAYAPRRPTETVLYGLVRLHLESFLAHAREHYESGLPRYVEQELRAYLKCGVFSEGFTRCHCDTCGHDLLVAFSCHGRTICPSCTGRRMANGAAHLVDRVLLTVLASEFVNAVVDAIRGASLGELVAGGGTLAGNPRRVVARVAAGGISPILSRSRGQGRKPARAAGSHADR